MVVKIYLDNQLIDCVYMSRSAISEAEDAGFVCIPASDERSVS